MASRLSLHEELCAILESTNVYYNPPASVNMKYPCIKYSLSGIDHKRANDRIYKNTNRYEIIAIDRDVESGIPAKILDHFPMCRFDRQYVADNLYHFVFTLHY